MYIVIHLWCFIYFLSQLYQIALQFYPVVCKILTQAYGFDGSLAEIEKIYEIAVNGSGDEKISAASVLCGASLVRGWNLQVSDSGCL